ncbi:NAD-glutamate dehydrogenase [Aliihoeflea sp. PC F10.4]
MAARKTASTTNVDPDAGAEKLAGFFKSRAPVEDREAYTPQAFAKAAELAYRALTKHKRGDSLVVFDNGGEIERQGRTLTAITIINDNMPFLFDSVMGEIAEQAGEAMLVLHPVVLVRHEKKGVSELVSEAGGAHGDADTDRVSIIHVHVARLTDEECAALKTRIQHVLGQVRLAVSNWKPMLARLDQAISEYRYNPIPIEKSQMAEAVAFLEWLRDDNFTFLGMRELRYSGGETDGTLERSPKGGLGILADPDVRVLRRGGEPVTTTPEIREFLHGPDALLVTKANAKSVVHRRIYLDYVGVKTFDQKGRLLGELRIVGLFTSTAYTRSVLKIPYLRSKVGAVLEKSGFDPSDHSGKALINVLESYPRDELFQISVPVLRKHAEAILALGERPRVRVLHRVDQFDRFVSVIVYVPRDRYDSAVRERIGRYLAKTFDGRLSAYYPAFPEGSLARVHFIIGRSGGKTPRCDTNEMEAALRDIVRTFDDALREEVSENQADPKFAALAAGFGEAYRNFFSARDAMRDAAVVADLDNDAKIAIDFYRQPGEKKTQASLKIYHQGEPVALSKRVPLLENMGFRVISERTFELARGSDAPVFLHDMELVSAFGGEIDMKDGGELLKTVFLSVWNGESDNDAYASLVQTAGLTAQNIGLLRAYGRYLQQAGIPQNQDFIASVLNRYPDIARHLISLFTARFDPAGTGDDGSVDKAVEAIEKALEDVPQIDDDAVIRRYLNLIQSTLRTNFYAAERDGVSLAFKLDSRALRGLPDPRPWREIFVYGPQVEGVHLRFGAVARGGLRWSDRAQDYRTEVLGLVKAQQVKNAVIVPVGAKGGFYPKQLPVGGNRGEIFEAGKAAYINFITSLLSVTDNLEDGKVVTPDNVLRHDGDDPYFVVAADKGTATFSDTANAISQAHGFWLDDAFASGGSAGYDHKKMGITARGAWEAVKRHFREMDRDIQTEPFTVVGVGDMSGDVFGNGMLLSHATRLIAAFDHRDIFIDPNPDAETSFEERKRLFDKGQSSWQDYDKSKLSEGGMIVSRNQKSIELSQAAADAIGLGATRATPVEIMRAILMAKVDLLWFGGIGTYARGSTESNADVGDKTNDSLRVTAAEIGAKVIGEGANLGVTQRARIEYGMLGGRCNSDAIDNSAGVNSSDVEVNIKIALASAMRVGSLTRPNRDKLLADMTDEVAHLVLANNYRQSLAISLAARRGVADLGYQERFMEALEARQLLDRAVEVLPSTQMMAERESRGQPLTRAEIGVLLAYAKLVLFDDLVASGLPDDAHLEADLIAYFPAKMAKKFPGDIKTHRLRREIIATQLANEAINRGGPSFVTRLQDLTGRSAADIVAAFTVVRDGFDLPALYSDIDALDTKIEGTTQLELYQQVGRLVHSASAWFLKNDLTGETVGAEIERLRNARKALEPKLGRMLPPFTAERQEERIAAMLKAGVSQKLAERVAHLHVFEMIPDIALVAETASAGLETAARAFFAVTDAFRIGRIADAARSISTADYYDGLAVARATDQINAARRGIAASALGAFPKDAAPVDAWIEAGGARISRTRERLQSLTEGGDITVSRLTVAAGLMADLTDVAVTN